MAAGFPGNPSCPSGRPDHPLCNIKHIVNDVMAMLWGVTDGCNLNTETVLGNGVMASCSRVKCQI
eukprot:7621579-Pyramimonas_sp.AAC.1